MKIVAVIPTWQRHRLLVEAIKCVDALGVDVVVVGSEGNKTREIATRFGAHYVEKENSPLGAKFNAGWMAAKELGPDYVMSWSDDALCTPGLLDCYPVGRHEYIGAKDIWFYQHPDTFYFSGYIGKRDDPIGVGRMVSTDALSSVGWCPYDPEAQRSLDASMTRRLAIKAHQICLRSTSERVVNVVGESNITKLNDFNGGELCSVGRDDVVSGLIGRLDEEGL